MNKHWPRYRRWKSRLIIVGMGTGLLICLVPLASLLLTLVSRGAPVISFSLLTKPWAPVGEGGGIAHAVMGSMCLLGVASLLAVPLGLANGTYLAQRSHTRIAHFTRLMLDVMSGVPAIIIGVFIYALLVRPLTGYSMMAGGVALGAHHAADRGAHERGGAAGDPAVGG